MMKDAMEHKPKLIFLGVSSHPRDYDYAKAREVADACGALLVADISHVLAYVSTGLWKNPFPYADVVISATYKAFRGPRHGMVFV